MIPFRLQEVRRVLCVGAHSDDIEIGCGGTILQLLQRGSIDVHWVVFSGRQARAAEATKSAEVFLAGAASRSVLLKEFRDGYFPADFATVKSEFEQLKAFQPDLVFTHYRQDRHQDHRVLSDLAWNTFRNHLVLEYEIPKYDGDLGTPNLFVPLDEEIGRTKVQLLCETFQTQTNKQWFTEDTFLGLMRLRAVECGSPTRYAEAFYCRKAIIG
jgi:LmbE family N-acetylglucosaminyl deacetylase